MQILDPDNTEEFEAPLGSLQLFATTVPSGWLACDGTEYAAASYPALAHVLGQTYGGTFTDVTGSGTAHASSNDSTAHNAFDHNINYHMWASRWQSYGTPTLNQWISYDFGLTPQHIRCVRIFTCGDERSMGADLAFESSLDNVNWTTVHRTMSHYAITGPLGWATYLTSTASFQFLYYYLPASATRRYWRIRLCSTVGGWGASWYVAWTEMSTTTTTFKVPDLRGCCPVGNNWGNLDRVGDAGTYPPPDSASFHSIPVPGEETHALTVAEMPGHSHGGTVAYHHHHVGFFICYGCPPFIRAYWPGGIDWGCGGTTGTGGDDPPLWQNILVGNTGGSVAHNNMQPYVSMVMGIKT